MVSPLHYTCPQITLTHFFLSENKLVCIVWGNKIGILHAYLPIQPTFVNLHVKII